MADDANQPEGVTIDRSGEVPRRIDKRGVLGMLHDELSKHFSAKDITVNNGGQRQGLMDAVDDAVKSAPAPGAGDY